MSQLIQNFSDHFMYRKSLKTFANYFYSDRAAAELQHLCPSVRRRAGIVSNIGWSIDNKDDLVRIANSRPVANIKTGRVLQPITDADYATGLGLQRTRQITYLMCSSRCVLLNFTGNFPFGLLLFSWCFRVTFD